MVEHTFFFEISRNYYIKLLIYQMSPYTLENLSLLLSDKDPKIT